MDKLFENYINIDPDVVRAHLNNTKKTHYKKGVTLGALATGSVILDVASSRHKRKALLADHDKKIAAEIKKMKEKEKKPKNVKNVNESSNIPVDFSISLKQKLFDRKVLSKIYELNESHIILDKMRNIYLLEQRNKAYENNNLDATMYYESLITF